MKAASDKAVCKPLELMGRMMGFSIGGLASRMNAGDSEDTASAENTGTTALAGSFFVPDKPSPRMQQARSPDRFSTLVASPVLVAPLE